MEEVYETSKIKSGMNVFAFLFATAINIAGFFLPPPFKRWTDYTLNYDVPNRIPDEVDLISLKRRGLISLSEYLTGMQKYGFDADRASKLLELSEKLQDSGNLVELLRRGLIDEKEYYERMQQIGIEYKTAEELYKLSEKRLDPDTVIRAWRRQIRVASDKPDYFDDLRDQGWSEDRIELLKKVTEYYPSPSDLILFAVREVYTPEIVEKYGMMEDLPKKFLEEAKKAGLPEEQAKNYWAAHWVLPSLGQGYEMLHRGIIDEEDLMTLMRTQDIMPYWRDKLMKISYRPLTRVDVRRMHKLGVLDEEGVKRAYMDLGYDEEKAELMTEFTIKYNEDSPEQEKTEEDKRREELRGLTRSVIISRYKKGSIDQETARSYLRDIGLSDEVIDFYIAQADYELEEEKEEAYITQYRKMFVNGIIDYNLCSDLLDDLGIPAKQKEYLLNLWELERIGKPSLPSKSELIRWVKKKLITLDKFKNLMSNLGYSMEFIELYLKDAGLIPTD